MVFQMFLEIGNDNASKFWEWDSSEEDQIDSDSDM